MRSFNDYLIITEAVESGKRCVISFGRCNPPTKGHLKLFKKVQEIARKNNAKALVFLSHTQDRKKNPLPYSDKLKLVKQIVPSGVEVVKTESRTIQKIMEELDGLGFKDVIFVVGSDRLKDFDWLKTGYQKWYSFDRFEIVSAGERDVDSEDFVQTVSASMARKAVLDDDRDTFKKCSPFNDSTTRILFDKLKQLLS